MNKTSYLYQKLSILC